MKKPAELFACLRVPEFPAQALLRLRADLKNRPCAVLEGEPPMQLVCSCNRAAYRTGVERSMTSVELDTFESVCALQRSKAEEYAARNILLECAAGFSPSIEDRSDDCSFVCVIDIAGTEKLYRPPSILGKTLLNRVRLLGFACSIAIASNFHAAVCLARNLDVGRLTVVSAGDESAALAPLPPSLLDLTEDQREVFSLWGIKSLGALAALPEKPLVARMGQEGNRLRKMAMGALPHLFAPIEPVFSLEEVIEFDFPVENLESLLFVTNTMLEQLIARAVNRAMALRTVTAVLSLESKGSHSRTVKPALPSNDRQLWIKLLHLDLESHPPDAAILTLRLRAEPGHTSKVQLGLFSPQLPDALRLDVTLARIRAIVGEDAVGSPVLSDTHRPDSPKLRPFQVELGSSSRVVRTFATVRQLRPPEEVWISFCEHRPASFSFRRERYDVACSYGPWLVGGEWWSASRWGFQQWDLIARSQSGETLYCCVARDLMDNRWQMVGLYD